MTSSPAEPGPQNRTNVRDVFSPPWAVRAGFQVVGRLAPAVAGDLALRLFATPPRPDPRRGGAGGAGAEAAAAIWNEAAPFSVAVRGQPVRAWRWGSGPAVLLVHGWGGRARQLAAFVSPLVHAGFSVVALDAPRAGASSRPSLTRWERRR
jgi:hypothetical protein